MVRAIVTGQARHTPTLGVFANKCLSSFDRSRAGHTKLNASDRGASSYFDINQAGICGPICARAPETQSRPRQPRPCAHADGCHLSAERGPRHSLSECWETEAHSPFAVRFPARPTPGHHRIHAVDHRRRDQHRGAALLGRLIDDIHGAQLQSRVMIGVGLLCHLHEVGRARAGKWLADNFNRLGKELTVDLEAKYF